MQRPRRPRRDRRPGDGEPTRDGCFCRSSVSLLSVARSHPTIRWSPRARTSSSSFKLALQAFAVRPAGQGCPGRSFPVLRSPRGLIPRVERGVDVEALVTSESEDAKVEQIDDHDSELPRHGGGGVVVGHQDRFELESQSDQRQVARPWHGTERTQLVSQRLDPSRGKLVATPSVLSQPFFDKGRQRHGHLLALDGLGHVKVQVAGLGEVSQEAQPERASSELLGMEQSTGVDDDFHGITRERQTTCSNPPVVGTTSVPTIGT